MTTQELIDLICEYDANKYTSLAEAAFDLAAEIQCRLLPPPENLSAALKAAHTGAPETCVESAIMVYQSAQTAIDRYELVKGEAKQLITDVMTETGQTSYTTRAGRVAVSAPSVTVSYDAKALDILVRDDADLAMRLAPYRKESERAGSLRITAAK